MQYLFALLFTMMPPPHAAAGTKCNLENSERVRLLDLNYKSFDQTPESGWRYFGEPPQSCTELGAGLIDAYGVSQVLVHVSARTSRF